MAYEKTKPSEKIERLLTVSKMESVEAIAPQPAIDADGVPVCSGECPFYDTETTQPLGCSNCDVCPPALLATIKQQHTCLRKIANTIGSISSVDLMMDANGLELLPEKVSQIIKELANEK